MSTAQSQTRPQAGEGSEAPRYLPLQTVSVEIPPPAPSRERIFGMAANVSQTGACVIVNRTVPVGNTIELRFQIAGRNARMTLRARVVWCAERLEPIKEVVGHLAGVAFVDAPERVQELLQSGVFQLVP